MLGIPIEHFVPVATLLGAALLGALSIFGLRWGQRQPTPADKMIEVAGALVDSAAVKDLTAALNAHRKENEDGRHQMRRGTDAMLKLAAAIDKLADETEEMRRDNQIARR